MKARLSKRAVLMTAAMLGMAANPYFRAEWDERTERANRRQQRVKDTAIQNAIKREMKTTHSFTIQGHTIEAYSKKDAIKRLKHQGLLK